MEPLNNISVGSAAPSVRTKESGIKPEKTDARDPKLNPAADGNESKETEVQTDAVSVELSETVARGDEAEEPEAQVEELASETEELKDDVASELVRPTSVEFQSGSEKEKSSDIRFSVIDKETEEVLYEYPPEKTKPTVA